MDTVCSLNQLNHLIVVFLKIPFDLLSFLIKNVPSVTSSSIHTSADDSTSHYSYILKSQSTQLQCVDEMRPWKTQPLSFRQKLERQMFEVADRSCFEYLTKLLRYATSRHELFLHMNFMRTFRTLFIQISLLKVNLFLLFYFQLKLFLLS